MQPEELWAKIDKLKPGTKKKFEILVPEFYGTKQLSIPVLVKKGSRPGKTTLITSAVHGDEVNHVNTCHRVYRSKNFEVKAGLLIILPVVNIYGYINKSRYLPDRRDLNRCFPGNTKGSLGSQIAQIISDHFITKADYIIDLHTGAIGRFNTPQVRCSLENTELKNLVERIQVPIILDSPNREGSLRGHATSLGKTCVVYEAGEALRLNPYINQSTLVFLKSFLSEIGLVDKKVRRKPKSPVILKKSHWMRSPESGLLITGHKEGKIVRKGQTLGEVRTIRGDTASKIKSQGDSVILGITVNPLVIKGDAIFHIGYIDGQEVEHIEDQDWGEDTHII